MTQVDTTLFVTEDLALATVLKIESFEPLRKVKTSANSCQWVYEKSPELDRVVDEYRQGECYHEVKDYTKKLSVVRLDMYQFLGTNRGRARS